MDNTDRYPFLLSFLDQAKEQLPEDNWIELANDIERFKLDVGVTFLKDFFDESQDNDLPMSETAKVLGQVIAEMYESRGIEPLDFGE